MTLRLLIAAFCLGLFAQPLQLRCQDPGDAAPQLKGLPDGDTDLVAARTAAVELLGKALALKSTPGATYDNEKAEKIAKAAGAVFQTLGPLAEWTEDGFRKQDADFNDRFYSIINAATRHQQAQELLMLHDFAHDFARYLMELADLASSLEKLGKMVSGQAAMGEDLQAAVTNPGIDTSMLERVMPLGQATFVVDFMRKWGERLSKVFGGWKSGSDTLNKYASAFADALKWANTFIGYFQKFIEARALGGSWKSVLKVFKVGGLAKMLFVPLEAISNYFGREIKERIAELEKEVEGYQHTQGQLFDLRTRLQYRAKFTRDIEQQMFDACVAFDNSLGRQSTLLTNPEPTDSSVDRYSSAFAVYVSRLQKHTAELLALLKDFGIGEAGPLELTLSVEAVRPGEEFSAAWKLPEPAAQHAWVGIVSHDTAHGNESAAALVVAQLNEIPHPEKGEGAEGSTTFKAPDQPGLYDVRLCDADADRELRFACIRVKAAGEGVKLAFGPDMKDYSQQQDTLTLPDADPDEHVEYPLAFVAQDADGKPVAGIRVEAQVLDAEGEETDQGPKLKGRYDLVSGNDGAITGMILWGVPRGSWQVRFQSPDAENVMIVQVTGAPPAARILMGLKPDTLSASDEKDSARTAFIYGWVEGLPAAQLEKGFVLHARVSAGAKLVVPGAKVKADSDGWRAIDIGMYCFMVTADLDSDKDSIDVEIELLDPKGAKTATATRTITLEHLPDGMGGLRYKLTAPPGLFPSYFLAAKDIKSNKEVVLPWETDFSPLAEGTYEIIARPYLRMKTFTDGVSCGTTSVKKGRITYFVARAPMGYVEITGVPEVPRGSKITEYPTLLKDNEQLGKFDYPGGFPFADVDGRPVCSAAVPPGTYDLVRLNLHKAGPPTLTVIKKGLKLRAFEHKRVGYVKD
ncbi:MAG: hypothetical protein K8I27_12820 [Planctomycetes bacterium]|nr:hypothetical protein [Planctomycetota bacterium]